MIVRALAACLAAALTTAQFAAAQGHAAARGGLAGVVRDTTGQPLPFVLVVVALDTPRTALTDSAGAFRLDQLPVGLHKVSFRRIGMAPAEFDLVVTPGETRRVTVELVSVPLALDTITVTGQAMYPVLERTGFYERQRQRRDGAGVGRFVTPEEMETLRILTHTSHVLGSVGVRVTRSESGAAYPIGPGHIIRSGQGRNLIGPCPMAVFIEGVEVVLGGGGLDAYVHPNEIRAIEVYQSASGTPMQFQSVRNALCGSIVIWTK